MILASGGYEKLKFLQACKQLFLQELKTIWIASGNVKFHVKQTISIFALVNPHRIC